MLAGYRRNKENIGFVHCKMQEFATKIQRWNTTKTLLLNRIKALEISKMSLTADIPSDCFELQELCDSVAPIVSIIKKCQKSQSKFDKENVWHKRFANIIYAMEISLSSISTQIEKMKRNQHAF